jgi:hypothetical protein
MAAPLENGRDHIARPPTGVGRILEVVDSELLEHPLEGYSMTRGGVQQDAVQVEDHSADR